MKNLLLASFFILATSCGSKDSTVESNANSSSKSDKKQDSKAKTGSLQQTVYCKNAFGDIEFKVFQTADGSKESGVLSGLYNGNLTCKDSLFSGERLNCEEVPSSSSSGFLRVTLISRQLAFNQGTLLEAKVMQARIFPFRSSELATLECRIVPVKPVDGNRVR